MTPPTLVAPELEAEIEQLNDSEHLPVRNGNGGSQGTLPVSPDSELRNLNEELPSFRRSRSLSVILSGRG